MANDLVFLIGLHGTGKSTIGRLMAKYHGYHHISLGDLGRLLRRRLIPRGYSLRFLRILAAHEPGDRMSPALIEALHFEIDVHHQSSPLVIDGFPAEPYHVAGLPENSTVIHLTCPDELRLQRLIEREGKTGRKWHEEVGRSSPSGQQPAASSAWFLKTPLRRRHSALILQLYAQSCKTLPKYAAFPYAYYHYARLTSGLADRSSWDSDPAYRRSEDDYVIPFSWAHFLTLIYNDDERADGVRKCQLQVRRCKSCGGLYLAHAEEIGRKCVCCSKQLRI